MLKKFLQVESIMQQTALDQYFEKKKIKYDVVTKPQKMKKYTQSKMDSFKKKPPKVEKEEELPLSPEEEIVEEIQEQEDPTYDFDEQEHETSEEEDKPLKPKRKIIEDDNDETEDKHTGKEKNTKDCIHVYCSCFLDKGLGAIGIHVEKDHKLNKHQTFDQEDVTTNKLDLESILYVLKNTKEFKEVIIYSSSEYVVKGVNIWSKGWEHNDWKTKSGEQVKNKNLFERILRLLKNRNVEIRWVPKDNQYIKNAFFRAKNSIQKDPKEFKYKGSKKNKDSDDEYDDTGYES